MDEADFIDAVEGAPGDRVLLQQYADWLIQQRDPRGDHLNAELAVYRAEDQLWAAMDNLADYRSTQTQHFAWLNAVFPMRTKAHVAGIIYRSPGPDERPLVEIGDMVTSDRAVAVIESQKVFYQVPAGHSGLVTEICFQDRDTVAAGDRLLQLIRPQKHEVPRQGRG